MRQLKYDASARYSLYSERVNFSIAASCKCENCGNVNFQTGVDDGYLFRYYTVNDGSLRGQKKTRLEACFVRSVV